ncbi:hypothetical protein HDU91_000112 [Kappamyces sp. JEL0680]|nr:hypothetical protein HDU91_000112 [Kappamyces sp. JEL0680]
MAATFLQELCDFHYCYVGCKNIELFALVDVLFISLNAVTLLLYVSYLAWKWYKERVVKEKPLRAWFRAIDKTVLLAIVSFVVRILHATFLRSIADMHPLLLSADQIKSYIRTNIYLEWVHTLLGGLSIAKFTEVIVHSASGGQLFQPILIGEKTVINPTVFIGIYRVVVVLVKITCASLFALKGVESLESFIFYRRLHHYAIGSMGLFVSMPIIWVFGSAVLGSLEDRYKELNATFSTSRLESCSANAVQAQSTGQLGSRQKPADIPGSDGAVPLPSSLDGASPAPQHTERDSESQDRIKLTTAMSASTIMVSTNRLRPPTRRGMPEFTESHDRVRRLSLRLAQRLPLPKQPSLSAAEILKGKIKIMRMAVNYFIMLYILISLYMCGFAFLNDLFAAPSQQMALLVSKIAVAFLCWSSTSALAFYLIYKLTLGAK